MKALSALALGLLLSACVKDVSTLPQLQPDPEIIYVLLKTEPPGATVTFPDGTVCETPCRVGVVRDVDMTVGRTGYKAVRRTITRMTPSPLILSLEPVVVDEDLEPVALPDLQ